MKLLKTIIYSTNKIFVNYLLLSKFFRKITFLLILYLITFTVVASNGIAYHQSVINMVEFSDRLHDHPFPYLNIPQPTISPSPFPPNPELPEQERFLAAVSQKLPKIPESGTYEYILLRQYGAAFVNPEVETKLPKTVIFSNEQETKEFQSILTMVKIDGTRDCYLQQTAGLALNKAKSLANISLKSGYGSGDCTRTFTTNLRFWYKYANDRTLEKVRQGKETAILSVVAPPGTSQHLWGLAIDLRVSSQKQRQALNQNCWFQTVESDIPHWTYLGLTEEQLPLFGFEKKVVKGITYWLTPI